MMHNPGDTILIPVYGTCTVTDVVTLKSGKVRLTVRTPKGKPAMVMADSLPTPIQTLPAATWGELMAEHRAERAERNFRNNGI